jgi:hypothetical protein
MDLGRGRAIALCGVASEERIPMFAHIVGNFLTWTPYPIPPDPMTQTLGSRLQPARTALLRCWPRYTLIISQLERSHFCLQLKGHLNGDDLFCYSQSSSPWRDHCHSPTIKSVIWMPCARSFFRWRSLMKTTRLVTSTTESL